MTGKRSPVAFRSSRVDEVQTFLEETIFEPQTAF
jgi:hypothetical protein